MITGISSINKFASWIALEAHYPKMRGLHLRKLFADDSRRGERMTSETVSFTLTIRNTALQMKHSNFFCN